MLPTPSRPARSALVTSALALAVCLAPRAARAEIMFQADATANMHYSRSTPQPTEDSLLQAEVRPALALQFQSPRLAWRTAYLFAGTFTLQGGPGGNTYSNQLDLSLMARPTPRSTLTFGGNFSQGGTLFQLSRRSADAGEPVFRASGDPALVTGLVTQAFDWTNLRSFRFRQGLQVSVTALQDRLERVNGVVTGALAFDRMFTRDALGVVYTPSFSILRPLTSSTDDGYTRTISNALEGSWNHDFNWRWNGQITAGAQEVTTLRAGNPTSIFPTGSITVRYLAGRALASLTATHAAISDTETGTVSQTDSVILRGTMNLERAIQRQLAASVGYLNSRGLGQAQARSVTGNAVQGDVGVIWGLTENILATGRYSLSYQLRPSANDPSLIHVLLVGITVRYGTTPYAPSMPALGGRVDGGDSVGFSGSGPMH